MPAQLPADLAAATDAKQHKFLVVALRRDRRIPVITPEIAAAICLAVGNGWKLVASSPTPLLGHAYTNPTDDETLLGTGPLLLPELRTEAATIFGEAVRTGYIANNAIATRESIVQYVDAETHAALCDTPAAHLATEIALVLPTINHTTYSYTHKFSNNPVYTGAVDRTHMSDLQTFLNTLDADIILNSSGVIVYVGTHGDIPTVMQIRQDPLQPALEELRSTPVPVFTHTLSDETADFITALY